MLHGLTSFGFKNRFHRNTHKRKALKLLKHEIAETTILSKNGEKRKEWKFPQVTEKKI